ncbi:MAG: hypothetical protein M5U12_23280 [Verrucomicrobia bacterium]|nr:hypothetical protein [Verrucomicrobiota bacterium]
MGGHTEQVAILVLAGQGQTFDVGPALAQVGVPTQLEGQFEGRGGKGALADRKTVGAQGQAGRVGPATGGYFAEAGSVDGGFAEVQAQRGAEEVESGVADGTEPEVEAAHLLRDAKRTEEAGFAEFLVLAQEFQGEAPQLVLGEVQVDHAGPAREVTEGTVRGGEVQAHIAARLVRQEIGKQAELEGAGQLPLGGFWGAAGGGHGLEDGGAEFEAGLRGFHRCLRPATAQVGEVEVQIGEGGALAGTIPGPLTIGEAAGPDGEGAEIEHDGLLARLLRRGFAGEQGVEVALAVRGHHHMEFGADERDLGHGDLAAQQAEQVIADGDLVGAQQGLVPRGLDAHLLELQAREGPQGDVRHAEPGAGGGGNPRQDDGPQEPAIAQHEIGQQQQDHQPDRKPDAPFEPPGTADHSR